MFLSFSGKIQLESRFVKRSLQKKRQNFAIFPSGAVLPVHSPAGDGLTRADEQFRITAFHGLAALRRLEHLPEGFRDLFRIVGDHGHIGGEPLRSLVATENRKPNLTFILRKAEGKVWIDHVRLFETAPAGKTGK